MNRGSLSIKVLRKLMKFNRFGARLLCLILRELPKRKVGHIYIVGVPRSGTTITYQRIISNFNVKYLDNYLHLMFGVPFLRGLSNWFKPSQKDDSSYGFVSGFRGAAEGLHFWQFWTKTGLIYNKEFRLNNGFSSYIDYLELSKRPFVTCYIPHLGYAREILRQDPNAFIVLLRRDSNSVMNSLKKIYNEKNIHDRNWFSYKPHELPNTEGLNAKIRAQVEFYYNLLEKDSKSDKARLVEVTYEEMVRFSFSTKSRILLAYNTFAKTRDLSILKLR